MADNLSHFTHDVFLSYGYSGVEPDQGDRAWVAAFKESLQTELGNAIGRKARIFFDLESTRSSIDDFVRDAAGSSVLLVFVMTPASATSEWCRRELDYFLSDSSPDLFGRDQVFVAKLREVPLEAWPKSLAGLSAQIFHTDGPFPVPLPAPPSADLGASESGRRVQTFAAKLAAALRKAEQSIKETLLLLHPRGVAEAWVNRLATERAVREIPGVARVANRVLRLAYESGQSEAALVDRARRWLMNAMVAVQVLPDVEAPPPPDWTDSPHLLVLRTARLRFDKRPGLVVWQENGGGLASLPAIESSTVDARAASPVVDLRGQPFEELESEVKHTIARIGTVVRGEQWRAENALPAVPNAPGAQKVTFVYLDCDERDLAAVIPLQGLLKPYRIRMRRPFFDGDEETRRRYNQEAVQESDAAAVYYGSRNDIATYGRCGFLCESLRGQQPVPKVVVLDPGSDLKRQSFVHPQFENWAVPSATDPQASNTALREILQLLGLEAL